MNKTAIKNFAVWARIQLIESAKQRAYEYEITENGENKVDLETIGGRLLSKTEKEQRIQLISQIRQKGYTQVMEEAAYTWFNRFVALRFMEVNGYLPSKVRVFTDESGSFKPEMLKEAMTIELDGLDRQLILELLDKQDNETLYKHLLIAQCNALNAGLPYMFEKIANWTELLFPANLLRSDSIIGRLISDVAPEDWNDEVEIIGWMYQYYISEKHDEVVDPIHGKTIKKEDIPAATQLFTTDWVVRYILDNSLGRYWIERHPESTLVEKLTYFVMPKDGNLPIVNESIRPEELKVLDPCVDSGHFLSYAFDVLLEIYRECGWSDRDAAKSIIENNLFGLDIDNRAAQLACFAISMKARKYNRHIFTQDTRLHVMAMQEADWITDELVHFVAKHDQSIRNDLNEIRISYNNAKEYGSIINMPMINTERLYVRIAEIQSDAPNNLVDIQYQRQAEDLLPLVHQTEILLGKYDVVATNPPYMNKYSTILKSYITEHFADYKGDLFSVFIYRNFSFCKPNGYSGFMTPMVWMFIKTYEELRHFIISEKSFTTLIQFEYSAFEEATVPICSFVLKNGQDTIKGNYFKLSDFRGGMDIQREKMLAALIDRECGYYFETDKTNYSIIPGEPLAYWIGSNLLQLMASTQTLGERYSIGSGLSTSDNERFLRMFWEVDSCKIGTRIHDSKKWYFFQKGGEYRKWYGNIQYVVNWMNDGEEIKYWVTHNPKDPNTTSWSRRIFNTELYFQKGITWGVITSSKNSFRVSEPDSMISNAAGGVFGFSTDDELYSLLGALNSKVWETILLTINPTINTSSGIVQKTPMPTLIAGNISKECVNISKADWDSFETSWNFKQHPLIIPAIDQHLMRLSDCWREWNRACDERFEELKANEVKLNRLFIDIYDLQDELTPDVDDKNVTIHKADLGRDIRSLISYAVGCMLGRYSVDKPGLVFAGGVWDASHYKTYHADTDGILPITDDEYFDDDIVGMFVNWVRTVYGADTLEENIRFIANALGGKGTPREVIRQYFLNDFYADHLKIYQKRPIYWLFSSGKKNGFKCLIYMHRYQPDMLARIRTDYVHEQQERYRTQLQMLEDALQTAVASDRVKLNKQITKLKDQALELQNYEEKIHHLADQMIVIDLDDGVKMNYDKFQDVLEKIK